ncbi:hypothetical protein [Methanocella conradii]|uniref:hypothetical protein n=1 Tax=Methanocella conradii TaxID=1175444 RepID=UPI00157D8A70|nr:hypothetical protein [Methanocella conradii]
MFGNADKVSIRPVLGRFVAEGTKEKLARAVSNIAQAPIISIPAFGLINYFSLDFYGFVFMTSLCILFAGVLPVLVVMLWSRNKKSESDLPQKEDRIAPLVIVITIYLAGTAALYAAGAPLLSTALMFCYFSNTLIVFFINIFWKISIHSMGVMGPTVALIFAFGAPGAFLGLVLPVVMWSRIYLKKHTISQVIMGALLGFVLTAAQIYLVYAQSGIRPDITLILWLVYAFIGPSIVLGAAGIMNGMGVLDGYTRKFFHFIGFVSIAAFLRYAPAEAAMIFIALGIVYVGIACFSGNGFPWFDGIRRKADSPNETIYVIMPMVSTVLGLAVCWALFGHPAVEVGMLCVAVGDAMAEPMGVLFGRHKYKVFSLMGSPSERSVEGSLVVLLSCSAIIFLFTGSPIFSLALGAILSLVEAVSPRGTDNFTVFLVSAVGIAIRSMIAM